MASMRAPLQACVDAIEIVEDGEPADFDAARFEAFPRIEIRRKLFFERDHDVAWLPGDAGGDGRDAFGGVLHDGDFGGRCVDQPRGGDAEAFIGLHPLSIVLAAELERVLREVLHGFGGAAGRAARRPRDSDRPDARVTGN